MSDDGYEPNPGTAESPSRRFAAAEAGAQLRSQVTGAGVPAPPGRSSVPVACSEVDRTVGDVPLTIIEATTSEHAKRPRHWRGLSLFSCPGACNPQEH